MDDETPTMPVLEEYLEEWGIRICRVQDSESGKSDNYHIRDTVQRLDTDGYTVLGNYVTSGLGSSVTKDMRNVAYPAKVVFPHATSVTRSDSYRTTYVSSDEASDGKPYSYEGLLPQRRQPPAVQSVHHLPPPHRRRCSGRSTRLRPSRICSA